MNLKQAAVRWDVTEYQARKICKHLGISPSNIPEDVVPVYLPDGRYKANPHRFYIFVLDVIINTHMELEGIDTDIIETCVEQLRNAGLIVLKRGKDTSSVDYHDYIISPNIELFYNWKNAKMRGKIDMIKPILSAVAEGVTAAGTMVAGVIV